MTRTHYLTDLSDTEGNCIASLFPAPAVHGRPRLHSAREILDAILYVLRSGCAWRLLPHDLPPWKTVSHSFRLWRRNGLWEQVHTVLRELVRLQMGREAQPSAAIIDSQSVKTIGLRGPRGYDDGRENQRTQAPSAGRYPRFCPQGQSACCRHHGSGWGEALRRWGRNPISPATSCLAGCWLQRQRERQGLDRDHAWLDREDCSTSTQAPLHL